jgi:NAD+ kinase
MNTLSSPVESIYISRNIDDFRTEAAYELLQNALGLYSIKEVVDIEQANAMVVVGGDGMFLEAARSTNYAPLPVTGISTGTLNYYMSTLPTEDSVNYLMRNLAEGDYKVHDLPLLELQKVGGMLVRLAVNDVVIKAQGFQAFKAGLTINDTQFEHFVGNGIACSTPQGSSGEGLANGGPFIREGLPVWAVIPEAMHQSKEYHSLVAPLILGADDELIIEIKEAERRPFIVGTDGALVKEWPQNEPLLKIALSKDKAIRRMQDVSKICRGKRIP